jgi:hypothetical protein
MLLNVHIDQLAAAQELRPFATRNMLRLTNSIGSCARCVYNPAVISFGPKIRTLFLSLAAIAMLVRVSIPTGFMPASVDDGWYLQLCPDGMPAHVMVALFGEHHAHHGGSADSTFFECDYDSGASGAVLIDSSMHAASEFDTSNARYAAVTTLTSSKRLLGFRSRAPPLFLRCS